MTYLNKLLLILFIIFLFIIFGEMFYFFNSKPQIKLNQNTKTIVQPPGSQMAVKPNNDPYTYWTIKKRPLLTSSIKIDESEGTITELAIKGGTMKTNGIDYPYALKITVKPNTKKEAHMFIYDENDLKKTVFLYLNKPIKQQDLKIGDKVYIKETVDLLTLGATLKEVVIKKL